MKVYKWLHAATAAALLGAFVGCDDQDFDTDSEAIETQPVDTYDVDPAAPDVLEGSGPAEVETELAPPAEDLQQNSQNNPLGAANEDDTLDGADTLNDPSALNGSEAVESPGEAEGAPAPAEQSPLDELGEEDTASEQDAASEGDEVAEDVIEQP